MRIQFGVQVETHIGFDYPTVVKIAQTAEKAGFDGFFMCDHLRPRIEGGIDPSVPILDTWTTLPAVAARTERITIGTLVTCVSFRQPSLLAKMAATVDRISNGRLILGMGAGWYKPEYEDYGYDFPSNRERIQRLHEAVRIIKMMWTKDRPNFEGKYYRIREAVSHPKPLQKPRPPLWIGGSGERYLLRVVAEEADACNFLLTDPETYQRKLAVLEKHCSDVRRSTGEIRRTLYTGGIIAESESELSEKALAHYGRAREPGESDQSLLRRMRNRGDRMIGTPEDWIAKIQEFEKLGVTYFIWYLPDIGDPRVIETIGARVIPAFR